MNEAYLYPYSAEYARQRGEESLWRASYLSNMDCKDAIRKAVWQHYDGAHLDGDCLAKVIQEFGYKRQLGCWLTRYSSWNGVASTVLRIKSGPVESISHQTNPTISTLWCQSVPLC